MQKITAPLGKTAIQLDQLEEAQRKAGSSAERGLWGSVPGCRGERPQRSLWLTVLMTNSFTIYSEGAWFNNVAMRRKNTAPGAQRETNPREAA